MNGLPVILSPTAEADVRGLPADVRPAVFEHLARIGANHTTCSRPTALPRPPGLESCLWLRRPTAAGHMLEVLFVLVADPAGVRVRRVMLTEVDRLPDWALRPSEWMKGEDGRGWPVVDL